MWEKKNPIWNDGELEECVDYWKEALELGNWRVASRLNCYRESEESPDVAISCSARKQWASLRVLTQTEREPADCVEVSVIQGLLELHFPELQFYSLEAAKGFRKSLRPIARALQRSDQMASDATEELERMRTFFIEGPPGLRKIETFD